MGAPAPPPGWRKKFFRRNSQKICTPRQSKSQFLGHFLLCQEDLELLELVVLDRLLEVTTKKGQLFEEKMCTPEKSWLRLWMVCQRRPSSFFGIFF